MDANFTECLTGENVFLIIPKTGKRFPSVIVLIRVNTHLSNRDSGKDVP